VAELTTLIYDYVEDVLERRAPHREEHLALIARWGGDGLLALAGPLGDPPTGALFVFEAELGAVESFVAADPPFRAGLVTAHRIAPWKLVSQRPLAHQAT